MRAARIGILGCVAFGLAACVGAGRGGLDAELQSTIARTAGEAPLSRITPFTVESGPSTGMVGSVEAVREFGSQLRCREIVYALGEGDSGPFTATICRGAEGWRWAVSQPATPPAPLS